MDMLTLHVVGVLQLRGLSFVRCGHSKTAPGEEISEFIAHMNCVMPPILLPPCQPLVEFLYAGPQNWNYAQQHLGAFLLAGVVGVPPVERGTGVCGDVRCAELCDKAMQASLKGVEQRSGRLLEVFWSQFGERYFKVIKHPRDAMVEGIIYLKVVEQLVECVVYFQKHTRVITYNSSDRISLRIILPVHPHDLPVDVRGEWRPEFFEGCGQFAEKHYLLG
ncbi:faimly transcriptional regulator, putative [Babesia ovata]|uniref:Faimly transcriptional regulator, putative n=1 Tax=Babesia ovata TaxID=189622 RepID=A0A2H6K848_9APIC|nr:faimly transcriptional regulator, putative [Babesia ovata]GBE59173.1 faimly transcriptional regulator, putative [Babesia ovata]